MDGDTDLAKDDLVDILKRRQIKTVFYFHADHFEPWSQGLNEKAVRGVERMREMSQASPFARKLSLFYFPYIPYGLDVARQDAVVFGQRSAEQEKLAREAIFPLSAAGDHEMHIHMHHEYWTRNESKFDSNVSQWVNAHSTTEMDRARLDFAFGHFKDVINREIGRNLDRWAFVHGNWALAASDPLICTVENELGTIMRHGGFGDFSFPAGRGYCDPKLLTPFTCLPIDARRAYDDPTADPRPVEFGSGVLQPERFFIWNSTIKARYSSLDYYYLPNRDLFREPERLVGEWLNDSVSLGDVLFVKTHAHSMWSQYQISEPDSVIPHCYPDVIKVFELLARVCDRARVEFRLVTVNEVMDWLGAFDRGQDTDLVAAPDMRSEQRLSGSSQATQMPAKQESVASLSVQQAVDLAGDVAPALRAWVRDDPDRMAGAGGFYHGLLGRDSLLQDYERAVLEYVAREMAPSTTRIVEVGVGYGILSILLAAMGYEVIAFEGDRRRVEGMRFLLDAVRRRGDGAELRLTPVHGWFPDAFDESVLRQDKRNFLLTTNVVNTATANSQKLILNVAHRFDGLIIDTTRFGIPRYEPEAAEKFRAEVAAGYQDGTLVWHQGANEIWHFKRPLETLNQVDAASESRQDGQAADVVHAGRLVTSDSDSQLFSEEFLSLSDRWMAGPGVAHMPDDLYAAKVSRRTMLENYEIAIAEAVGERFDRSATIVEIGSGYGALALLLARSGFVVRGVEGDRRRSAAFTWHLEQYLARHPELAERVSCTAGFFPDVRPGGLDAAVGKVVCVATNITHSHTANHHDAILDAVTAYDELIIDLSRFGRPRDLQAERDALREELVGRGFEPVERLYFAIPYEYWHFRTRRKAAKAEQAAPAVRAQENSRIPFSVYGRRRLDACPVCQNTDTEGLWRVPISALEEPVGLFAANIDPAPSLRTPATIFCFDFCHGCDCVFLNPVPDEQDAAARSADRYQRPVDRDAGGRGYEDVYDQLAQWIPDKAATLMDVACGGGQFLKAARKQSDQWRRLIGLERSAEIVGRLQEQGIEAYAVDLDKDDVSRKVDPNSVDFVVVREPFQWVDRPIDTIIKLLALLRPGGRLYFSARRYGKDVQAALGPDERIYLGERTISALPHKLGCRVINVSTGSARYHVILEK